MIHYTTLLFAVHDYWYSKPHTRMLYSDMAKTHDYKYMTTEAQAICLHLRLSCTMPTFTVWTIVGLQHSRCFKPCAVMWYYTCLVSYATTTMNDSTSPLRVKSMVSAFFQIEGQMDSQTLRSISVFLCGRRLQHWIITANNSIAFTITFAITIACYCYCKFRLLLLLLSLLLAIAIAIAIRMVAAMFQKKRRRRMRQTT